MTNVQIPAATGGRRVFEALDRSRSTAVRADMAEVQYRTSRDDHVDSARVRREILLEQLEDRQNQLAANDGRELLQVVAEAGLAWRDVAKLVGVSVPALQKWRRGDGITGENRFKLAKVCALFDLLDSRFISDPPSWLEMPVKEDVLLSRLDLLLAGRYDLVIELASEDQELGVAERVLTEVDPHWRVNLRDSAHETFVDPEGIVGIRPKSRG